MRSTWRIFAASAAMLFFCPQISLADNLQDELREMRTTLEQLQQQLRAQEARIAEQERAVVERQPAAAALPAVSSESPISAFLRQTEISGFLAASYTLNARGGDNNAIIGQNVTLPLHPDSNSFQDDQAWFSFDKAVSESSRAGFHIDLLFGKTASLLGGNAGAFGNDGVELFTAYVSYLAPIGNGVQIDIGELGTLLGAEVVQANANFNITRGLVWGLQPITHTGVIASTDLGGVTLKAGFLNDVFSDTNRDADNGKAFTGGIGMGEGDYSLGLSVIYGTDGVPNTDVHNGVFDALLSWQVSDELSAWFNFDYAWSNVGGGPDSRVFGSAVAARYAVSDTTGIAARAEWLAVDGGADAWSLTATLDREVADSLTLRGEVRYDTTTGPDAFPSSSGNLKGSQWVFLTEAIYEF